LKSIYAFLCLFILTSCASVPTGKIFSKESLNNADKALVILFRVKGHARVPTVYIDGLSFTRLGSGMYATKELTPGVHIFETKGGLVGESEKFSFNVVKGKTYYVRWLGIDSSVRTDSSMMPVMRIISWKFESVDENDALPLLKQCKKILLE